MSNKKPHGPLVDRGVRFMDIIDATHLQGTEFVVVGVGAIGRQVALQLACIGVPHLTLWDDDRIAEENVGAQGYPEAYIGEKKVVRTGADCMALSGNTNVCMREEKWEPVQPELDSQIIFTCTDNMAAREQVYKTGWWSVMIDMRMAAEVCSIFTVDAGKREYSRFYESTLFPDKDGLDAPCTRKTTIYCSNIAAGLGVAQYTKWLRGFKVEKRIDYNITTSELGVVE